MRATSLNQSTYTPRIQYSQFLQQMFKMSKPCPDHEDGSSDRYERLEELLRQTLTLAGEIAEDEGRPLPGECIIVRRRSNADPTGSNRQDIRFRLLKRRKALKLDESEDSQSQSPSPASSVQEPFSPGSLAVSLDAVVEKGKTSDNDLCVLDSAPATSAVARFAESPSNRSSLLSTDEGQYGLAAQTSLPHLLSNANVPKRLLRPSLPQKNTSMIVHSGQESLAEASTETCVPQQTTARHDRSGRCRTPTHESPQGSPARSRTPKSHQNSDTVLKRSQNIEDERLKGETAAANQPLPPKWHIRIIPVASSRDSGSPSPSSPALMKLEAVFPLKASAEGNATSSLGCNGEPSYILLSRSLMDPSPESSRPQADDGEDILVAQEQSLQEFIREWQHDAESPGMEERKL